MYSHKIWIKIRSLGHANGWGSTITWLERVDVVSNVPKPIQSQGKWTKDYVLRKKNLWKQWNRYKWFTWYKFKIIVIKMVIEVRKAMARTKRISTKRWKIKTIKWIIKESIKVLNHRYNTITANTMTEKFNRWIKHQTRSSRRKDQKTLAVDLIQSEEQKEKENEKVWQ